MNARSLLLTSLLLTTSLAWADGSVPPAQGVAPMHATGTFEVRISPQQPDNPDARAAGLGRLALDKHFQGALQARGQGEMLAYGDGRQDGGYVAIEKISGTLDGHSGSFALMHRALLRNAAAEQWSVLVVPGSGTGALAGIDGAMTIRISEGVHHYDLAYTLPARSD